ncbi:MAG TPA: CHAD domain-containing protein [Nitrososphaerales archaeon]|nr:CHAD domain-containing protein [Nitrososphaerales archaeon]
MSRGTLLSKSYRKASKEFGLRLEKIRDNPSIDNVHDLRTSIRRWEAVVDLFPKNVRKSKKMKRYLSAAGELFRSTTPVRDLDVVSQNISHYSGRQNSSVISTINHDRALLVSNALHFSESLAKIDPPKIRKRNLSSKAIAKRQDRLVKRLVAKLREELPVVLGDYRKIKELHDMRKECKKLRYILELFPSDRYEDLALLMKDWQTILGSIRDIDVTQQFAEEKGLTEDLEDILTKLRISRDKLLGSFTSTAKLEKYAIPAGI